MSYRRYVILLSIFFFVGCKATGSGSYQVPVDADVANMFIYTPDTHEKSSNAVLVYVDKMRVGEVAENRPLQFSIATGWHKVVAHRKSALGAREELAKFDILVEKDHFYYVRYDKNSPAAVSTGTPLFGVVDENIGRQMQ